MAIHTERIRIISYFRPSNKTFSELKIGFCFPALTGKANFEAGPFLLSRKNIPAHS